MFGAGGGTGQYARTLGLGYYQFGAQAAWQPMTTEQPDRLVAQVVVRVRHDVRRRRRAHRHLPAHAPDGLHGRPAAPPGRKPARYLALRGGVELFRANEPIPPRDQRAFVGPVAAAAIEQYAFGAFLFNVDVRYGLIGTGPAEIALLAGVSISVP